MSTPLNLLAVSSANKPFTNLLSNHMFYYPTPSNLSYNWSYGSLIGLIFALQLLTGIILAMHYTPHTEYVFAAVEHIMTDVNGGYIFRYCHANGAFVMFILIYTHMARNLYYQACPTSQGLSPVLHRPRNPWLTAALLLMSLAASCMFFTVTVYAAPEVSPDFLGALSDIFVTRGWDPKKIFEVLTLEQLEALQKLYAQGKLDELNKKLSELVPPKRKGWLEWLRGTITYIVPWGSRASSSQAPVRAPTNPPAAQGAGNNRNNQAPEENKAEGPTPGRDGTTPPGRTSSTVNPSGSNTWRAFFSNIISRGAQRSETRAQRNRRRAIAELDKKIELNAVKRAKLQAANQAVEEAMVADGKTHQEHFEKMMRATHGMKWLHKTLDRMDILKETEAGLRASIRKRSRGTTTTTVLNPGGLEPATSSHTRTHSEDVNELYAVLNELRRLEEELSKGPGSPKDDLILCSNRTPCICVGAAGYRPTESCLHASPN